MPTPPLDPIPAIQAVEPQESSAPNALGPRVQGQGSPKLGENPLQPPQASDIDGMMTGLDPTRDATAFPPSQSQDAVSAAYDKPPIQHHYSLGEWFGNFGDDVESFVKGIPAAFKVAWDAGRDIVKNYQWIPTLAEHPELIAHELDNTGRQVIKALTDTYKDGIGEAMYRHPFNVMLDATTAFDLAGGVIKNAGRGMARLAGDVGKTGAIDAASGAGRLMSLGESLQTAPARLLKGTLGVAGDALMMVPGVKSIAQNLALTPTGMMLKDLWGQHKLAGYGEATARADQLLAEGLTKAQFQEYNRLVDGEIPLSMASNDVLKQRAQLKLQQIGEDESWMTAYGYKTPEELEAARYKNLAIRLKARPVGDPYAFEGELLHSNPVTGQPTMTQEAIQWARDYAAGKNPYSVPTQPIYSPFLHERSFNLNDLFDALRSKDDSKLLDYISKFEKKTGLGPGVTRDPNVYETRNILQMEDLKSTHNFINDAVMRVGKPLRMGSEVEPGYVVMNPVLQRYLKDGVIPGYAKIVDEVVNGLRTGGDLGETLVNTLKKYGLEASQGAEYGAMVDAFRNPANWQTQIPRELAYILQSNLGSANPFARFYDKILNTWRSAVTMLMPRFYVNTLLGHSVLMMFGGVKPFTKAMALRESELPGEVLHSLGFLNEIPGQSSSLAQAMLPMTMRKAVNWLSDITMAQPRQVTLLSNLKDIAEAQARIQGTIAEGMRSSRNIEQIMEQSLQARKQLMELGAQKALAAQKIAASDQLKRIGAFVQGDVDTVKSAEQVARIEGINKEISQIQEQMKTERNLTNMNPEKGMEKISDEDYDAIFGPRPEGAPLEPNSSIEELKRAFGEATGNAPPGTSKRLEELEAQLRMKLKQRDAIAPDVPYKYAGKGLGSMPDVKRLMDLQAQEELLRPLGAMTDQAVNQMEMFLGNYGRLHPLERDIIRRIIPFWTFARSMTSLVAKLPFTNPKTAFLWQHYAKFMNDALGDDRLPYRYRYALPIGGTPDGHMIFFNFRGMNPWSDVKSEHLFNVPIPGFVDPMQNPFLKMWVEGRAGVDTFTQRMMTTPEDFTSYDGRVWKLDPNHHIPQLTPILPQNNFAKSLLTQFPHVKFVQELLDGFTVGRKGLDAIGGGITPQNPDGTYLYDRQPWYAIARAFGFPIQVSDPERVAKQHALLVKGMIQRFQGAARRMGPDVSAQLLKIVNDLKSGGYELREW